MLLFSVFIAISHGFPCPCGVHTQTRHAPHLSIVDNFFEMGGHSLMAAELVGKLNELGLAVAITDLYVCLS